MKRFCVVCGKELNIVLGDPQEDGKKKIVSGGGYWKFGPMQGEDFEPKTIEEQTEYWECKECIDSNQNDVFSNEL